MIADIPKRYEWRASIRTFAKILQYTKVTMQTQQQYWDPPTLPRGRVTSSLPELLVSDSAVAGGSEILWLLVSRRETMWLLVTAARRGTVGNRVLMKLIDANYIGLLKL